MRVRNDGIVPKHLQMTLLNILLCTETQISGPEFKNT